MPVNKDYPIKALLLTPADVITVLCDSFYNDIKTSYDSTMTTAKIDEELTIIVEKIKNNPSRQSFLEEDDIYEIQEYFERHLSKAGSVLSSIFFQEIPLIIEQVRPEYWSELFSLLWNKNEVFTKLFAKLIDFYMNLDFYPEVYLPISAVLYKKGTLLDVKRLKEIYGKADRVESEYQRDTKVLLPNNEERVVLKSYLCALSAELVFSQPESLHKTKPFLRETDLLDFPGARSRLNNNEALIETETIPELLLRGKVAYLFNRYSDAEKINILIFSAKHEQASQRLMPEMLNTWIENSIGKDSAKRDVFINKSKVSPLFIIGTFFNVNLQYDPLLDKANDDSHLNYRWDQRFKRTLAKELLDIETYEWFENWTVSQRNFQNIYLLRDFEKSESISQIFKGFVENNTELEEVIPSAYPNFRSNLRKSFINHDFVKRHFNNPAKSWDEAASLNKDGTDLIIENLSIAADNINEARSDKIVSELSEISSEIITQLDKYFHSNDKDEELQKAKSIAGDIQLTLDKAFSADGIKDYGQLMNDFLIDESTVVELYRKETTSLESRDTINLDKYNTYRMHVPVKDEDTPITYFERLASHYEKHSDEDKQRFITDLEREGIDLDELIHGGHDMIKNRAQQLADSLLGHWLVSLTDDNKKFVKRIFSNEASISLEHIKEMFEKLFMKLDFSNRVAYRIRRYIDNHHKADIPFEIIADISAELLNKCIISVGYDYLDKVETEELKEANSKNNLGLVIEEDQLEREGSVGELFAKIDNWTSIIQSNPEEMKNLANYRNYLQWYNRLKIGFVSVCDIPNYDIHSNERLGEIISEFETIRYS